MEVFLCLLNLDGFAHDNDAQSIMQLVAVVRYAALN
jgi:hypothetical protein